MNKIFCIIGKSGSGKDTLLAMILEKYPVKRVPLYTTRPMRDGEENGKEYYFITNEELEQHKRNNNILELREYDTVHGKWCYATAKFALDHDYITIATFENIQAIIDCYGENNVVILYMDLDEEERILRCINREKTQKNPDYEQLCKRFVNDALAFRKIDMNAYKNLQYINCAESKEDVLQQWDKIYKITKGLPSD